MEDREGFENKERTCTSAFHESDGNFGTSRACLYATMNKVTFCV